MTLPPLGLDFLAMSTLSRRRPATIPLDEQLIALDDELARRRHVLPALVVQGRADRAELERHVAVLAAIVEEAKLEVHRDAIGDLQHERRSAALRAGPVRWVDAVRELRRMLAIARNALPRQVEQRRLTETDARERLERLDGAHWRWRCQLAGLLTLGGFEGWPHERVRTVYRGLTCEVELWHERAATAGDPAVGPFGGWFGEQQREWADVAACRAGLLCPEIIDPAAHGADADAIEEGRRIRAQLDALAGEQRARAA